MVCLTDLPEEILLIIISHLLVIPNTTKESLRRLNRNAILPLTPNHLIWEIAKPFLYQDIELLFNATVEPIYRLKKRTYLLIRTFQDNPALKSHVRSLKVKGLFHDACLYWRDYDTKCSPDRHALTDATLNASEVAALLITFVNTRVLKIVAPYGLYSVIHHHTNQTILSCIKSMKLLQFLEIGGRKPPKEDEKSMPHPVIHFLNAAPRTLQSLQIGTTFEFQLYVSDLDEEFPDYKNPAPFPRFKLKSLTMTGEKLPWTALHPWISEGLQSLAIHPISPLEGQIYHCVNLQSLLAQVASTLRELNVKLELKGDGPSLTDMNMSKLPLLESFKFFGPWMITDDDQAADICEHLFSKRFRLFRLEVGYTESSPRMTLKSIRRLREALLLSHQQNHSPSKFGLAAILGNDRGLFDPDLDVQLARKEFESIKQDMVECGIEVEHCLIYPEDL